MLDSESYAKANKVSSLNNFWFSLKILDRLILNAGNS